MFEGPDPKLRALLDCRVTITLIVAASTLSILRLQGSDFGPLIADAGTWKTEPWRLVTTTLLHVDVLHLALNLYWIARFGMIVERTFGSWPTAGLLALFAVTSSAPQVALDGAGIGLSGIVYGLFGFLWVLSRWDHRHRVSLDGQTIALFVLWFFYCIVATFTKTMPVGNVAHGAGAIVGAATGWAAADRRPGLIARGLPLFVALSAAALSSTVLQPYLANADVRNRMRGDRAFEALEQGDAARAERLLDEMVAQDPEGYWGWWTLGVARWKLGDYESAVAAFERSASLKPPSPEDQKFLVEAREYVQRSRGLRK